VDQRPGLHDLRSLPYRGVGGGLFIRGSQSANVAAAGASNLASTQGMGDGTAQPTPEQIRHMADKQAAPLLAQLKTDPDNPDLLGKVGNIYCYTQQFPTAIEYYQRSGSSSWQAISIRCLPRTPAETGRTHLPKIATTQDAEIADQIEARRAQLEGSRLILRRHLDMRPSVVTSRRCRQRGALRFTT